MAMFREAMLANRGGDHTTEEGKLQAKRNIITDCSPMSGTSRAYSISRVQRECDPEVVKEVMAGKLSPDAALVKAAQMPSARG